MFDESPGPTLRVMSIHALVYCERLFYLEEVEEIRVVNEAVFAGRTLHEELDEPGEVIELTMESEELGLRGRVDALRRRDGKLFPVEHKRGRSMRDENGKPAAWPSDQLQATAYAMLVEAHTGERVEEVRLRYHRDNVTVRVPVRLAEQDAVHVAVEQARRLAVLPDRPPITQDERKCVRCSLAPVCLPEEGRFAQTAAGDDEPKAPARLYPPDTERRSLHLVTQGAKIGRSGDCLDVWEREAGSKKVGVREVSDVVIHGHGQITTQALRMCADEGIPVHYVTMSGSYVGGFSAPTGGVQRRIRQYRGLVDDEMAIGLARRLIVAKLEMQLRHVLRASRKEEALRDATGPAIEELRTSLRGAGRAAGREELLGYEGSGARAYFGALAELVHPDVAATMRPSGRSRRPPEDRFNALLSFGYGLLFRDVLSAIWRVGLEPSFGLLHQPRSAAYPLVLDLMEIFRVPLVDIAVLGAVNRGTFRTEEDFVVTGRQVWLSESGRKKLLELHERRKQDEYRHDRLGLSLSYARLIELEVRLLEKEWSGEPGLFATLRIR